VAGVPNTESRTTSPRVAARAPTDRSIPVLACHGLRKRYGDLVAVDAISLEIAPGEAVGLLGPNGAGKTTTIKMLCGLLRPDAGEVLVAGERIGRRSPVARRAIGYVPHEIALYPELTATENLAFWGRLNDLSGRALAAKIDSVLDIVDLRPRAADKVREFSSGMQRRLNLAVALLGDPRLLVLDEPTVGVDPHSRGAILERLRELRASGVAMLYASHYIDEVERFCDSVAIIDHGALIATGRPADLIASLGGTQRLQIGAEGDMSAFIAAARAMADVRDATLVDGVARLVVVDAATAIPRLVESASVLGVTLNSIDIGTASLEEVFLQLTGRRMRD